MMSFGFGLNELAACGVTSNSNRRSHPIPVTNAHVNSFWRQENFRLGSFEDETRTLPLHSNPLWDWQGGMVPDHIYHRMLPALRLATTMLEISLPFFMKVTYAEIGYCVDAEFSKIMIFDEGYEPNSHESREYYDELAKIAKYYRVWCPFNFIEEVRHYSRSA